MVLFRSAISVFFFQAEDGIRDIGVTGVQTCALPIYGYDLVARGEARRPEVTNGPGAADVPLFPPRRPHRAAVGVHEDDEPRSEERRVGKECRSRRSPYY